MTFDLEDIVVWDCAAVGRRPTVAEFEALCLTPNRPGLFLGAERFLDDSTTVARSQDAPPSGTNARSGVEEDAVCEREWVGDPQRPSSFSALRALMTHDGLTRWAAHAPDTTVPVTLHSWENLELPHDDHHDGPALSKERSPGVSFSCEETTLKAFLEEHSGDDMLRSAVSATCSTSADDQASPCSVKRVYLKDWHAVEAIHRLTTSSCGPNSDAFLELARRAAEYDVPSFLGPDDLNAYCDAAKDTAAPDCHNGQNLDEVDPNQLKQSEQTNSEHDDEGDPDRHLSLFGSGSDYRFVYIGPPRTQTPLHVDVCGTYSWSLNLHGRKRWYFGRRRDFHVQWAEYVQGGGRSKMPQNGLADGSVITTALPSPADTADGASMIGGLPSPSLCHTELDVSKTTAGAEAAAIETTSAAVSFTQHPGDLVFVPAAYLHEVHNTTASVSVNHNWCSAASAPLMARLFVSEAEAAEAMCDTEAVALFRELNEWGTMRDRMMKGSGAWSARALRGMWHQALETVSSPRHRALVGEALTTLSELSE